MTIIELMIVVALILLLLGMLVPGLAAARDLAMKYKCLAQLKEMGNGFQAFSANTSGEWPIRSGISQPNQWNDDWKDALLEPYMNEPRIFYCPSNSETMTAPSTGKWSDASHYFSYAILDGQPGPADPTATAGGGYNWTCEIVIGDDLTERRDYRPYLGGSRSEVANMPVVGDLCLIDSDGSRNQNHAKALENPPYQNMLFADFAADSIYPDENEDEPDAGYEVRWRDIWLDTNNNKKLRWIWGPENYRPVQDY
jgi:type II secretory pathway pseudopilin PulG